MYVCIQIKKEATEVFKLILGYMGDRKLRNKDITTISHEIVTKGWQHAGERLLYSPIVECFSQQLRKYLAFQYWRVDDSFPVTLFDIKTSLMPLQV